jgi:ParB-like nuclease family protein
MSNVTRLHPRPRENEPELKFHPLANVFPLMEGAAFDELVADIKAHGLIEPAVLYDEMILDGRNRYRACIKAGIEPKFTPFRGSDPAAFVISKNINRRHLTTAQRAAIAADLATMKSGARTDLAGNQARSQSRADLASNKARPQSETDLSSNELRSQDDAAKALKVSVSSLKRATAVKKASPELHEQVKEGKITLAAAERAAAPAGGKRAAKKAKAERNRKARERREAKRKQEAEAARKAREIESAEAKAKAEQLADDLIRAKLAQRVYDHLRDDDPYTLMRVIRDRLGDELEATAPCQATTQH